MAINKMITHKIHCYSLGSLAPKNGHLFDLISKNPTFGHKERSKLSCMYESTTKKTSLPTMSLKYAMHAHIRLPISKFITVCKLLLRYKIFHKRKNYEWIYVNFFNKRKFKKKLYYMTIRNIRKDKLT